MKPNQLYYGLLGLLALVIIGGLAGFWIAHKQLDNKISTLRKLSGDLSLENDQISRLQKLESQYKQIEPLANKASSVLPDRKHQDEVVAQVSTIVKNNGLELAGLTFDDTSGLPDERSQTIASGIGGISVMPVRFQTTGRYEQLDAMLRDFEKQQRFMRVSTLEITRNQDGSASTNIVLEVYLKP